MCPPSIRQDGCSASSCRQHPRPRWLEKRVIHQKLNKSKNAHTMLDALLNSCQTQHKFFEQWQPRSNPLNLGSPNLEPQVVQGPLWPLPHAEPATQGVESFAFQDASGQRVPKGRGSRFGSTWRLATRPLYGPSGRPRLLGRNFWGGNCPSAPGTPRKTTRCAQMGLGFTCERAMVKDTQQASDASLNSKAV